MKQGMLVDWEITAALLANESDDVQVRFFKALVKEMMAWPTHVGREMQLCFINKRLSTEEKDLLKCLVMSD